MSRSLVLLIILFALSLSLKPDLAATIQLQPGWNMFSIPVNVTVDADTIRSKCGTNAKIWNYNPSSRSYVDSTQLVPGVGYWIRLSSVCSVSVDGSAISVSDFPSLNPGWNQIGATSQSIDFSTIRSSTNCNILSGPWLYNSSINNYNSSNTLNPGVGYWLRVGSSCSLGGLLPPPQNCSDGTDYGQCSSVEADKPDWCSSTGLVPNQCNSPHNCPCPSSQSCNSTTGACYTPTSCDSTCKSKGYGSGNCESGTSGQNMLSNGNFDNGWAGYSGLLHADGYPYDFNDSTHGWASIDYSVLFNGHPTLRVTSNPSQTDFAAADAIKGQHGDCTAVYINPIYGLTGGEDVWIQGYVKANNYAGSCCGGWLAGDWHIKDPPYFNDFTALGTIVNVTSLAPNGYTPWGTSTWSFVRWHIKAPSDVDFLVPWMMVLPMGSGTNGVAWFADLGIFVGPQTPPISDGTCQSGETSIGQVDCPSGVCCCSGAVQQCTPGNDIIKQTSYPSGSCLSSTSYAWSHSTCGSTKVCNQVSCNLVNATLTSYTLPSDKYARSETISIPYTIKNTGNTQWCFITEAGTKKSDSSNTWPNKFNSVAVGSSTSDSLSYPITCSDPLGAWSGSLYTFTDYSANGGWKLWGAPTFSFNVVECLNDKDCTNCLGSGYTCNTTTNACYITPVNYNSKGHMVGIGGSIYSQSDANALISILQAQNATLCRITGDVSSANVNYVLNNWKNGPVIVCPQWGYTSFDFQTILNQLLTLCSQFPNNPRVWVELYNEYDSSNPNQETLANNLIAAIRKANYTNTLVWDYYTDPPYKKSVDSLDNTYQGFHWYAGRYGVLYSVNPYTRSYALKSAGITKIVNTEVGADTIEPGNPWANPPGFFTAGEISELSSFLNWSLANGVSNSVWSWQDWNTSNGYAAYGFNLPPVTNTCSDGTSYGQCSSNKPLYCSSGALINNCGQCGCASGYTCNTTTNACYITPSGCSALTYSTDRWQRVYYVHSTGACLGNGPDQTSQTFDDNWASGIVAYNQADDIEFHSSRTINFATAGTYTFTLGSDDGARLWIDNTLEIDKWFDRSYATDSVTLSMAAGTHRFRIDYYENGGAARVSFSYSQTVTSGGWKVFQNSTSNYLQNKSGQVIMSSSDATTVINAAIANAVSGDTIYIDAGTYKIPNGERIIAQHNNITLTLATGTVLVAGSGYVSPWETGLITVASVSGWTIQGGEIDGAANGDMVGVIVRTSTNVTIQNMYVHNIGTRGYGIFFLMGCHGCKALNNTVAYVGANGITLGFYEGTVGVDSIMSYDLLAQGNTVTHCADVGIDLQGVTNAIVKGNEAAYMDTFNGYVQSHWGIGMEVSVYNALIEGNTVHDIHVAYTTGPHAYWGGSCIATMMPATVNTVTGNNLYNCDHPYEYD